ncbi:hypothetical protein WA1_07420 [Scytonema hofmannii PCC 7110]|uniref:Uncharacterized protein n=2 Tax=Scytonema hofmannii TaxID=34078 RepID=A0A139WT77_9CYAN|nr:hypothetical protein WA1_07420 [Scytonema hofmannii PCC 7110]
MRVPNGQLFQAEEKTQPPIPIPDPVKVKIMNLVGTQKKQFGEALIDAFPRKNDLEMMLSYELDWNLNQIVCGSNYKEIVFELIQWAEARGKIKELLQTAKKANPGNPQLQNFSLSSADNLDTTTHSEIRLSPKPPESPEKIRRQMLEKQYQALEKQYQELSQQLSFTINAGDRVQLDMQLEDVYQRLKKLSDELGSLSDF